MKKVHGMDYDYIETFLDHVNASIDFVDASAFNKSTLLKTILNGQTEITILAGVVCGCC